MANPTTADATPTEVITPVDPSPTTPYATIGTVELPAEQARPLVISVKTTLDELIKNWSSLTDDQKAQARNLQSLVNPLITAIDEGKKTVNRADVERLARTTQEYIDAGLMTVLAHSMDYTDRQVAEARAHTDNSVFNLGDQVAKHMAVLATEQNRQRVEIVEIKNDVAFLKKMRKGLGPVAFGVSALIGLIVGGGLWLQVFGPARNETAEGWLLINAALFSVVVGGISLAIWAIISALGNNEEPEPSKAQTQTNTDAPVFELPTTGSNGPKAIEDSAPNKKEQ